MNWIFPLSILTASAFLMEMSFTMITPFLPVYLVQELGVADADVGLWGGMVYSVTFFISGMMGPVWGVLADRKSRKLMALRASFALAIAYALCGVVTSPGELFAARFFQGFAAGLYPALLALIASVVPQSRIGLAMGVMQGGMTVGGITGPFIGGVLAEWAGMRPSFFIAGVALFAVTLMIVFFVKEAPHKPGEGGGAFFDFSVLRKPGIMRLMIFAMMIYASLFSIQPILPLYLAELNQSMEGIMLLSGTVFSICAIPLMIASPLLGAAGQRFGFSWVMMFCLIATGLLTMVSVTAGSVTGFTVWRFLGGFAVAGLIPTLNALLSVRCPPGQRGRVFGLNFLFGHIGMSAGPMLAGAVAGTIGYPAVIVCSGFILLPLVAWLLPEAIKRQREGVG